MMRKSLNLLILLIIFFNNLYSQNKKFRILNEYNKVIDCKVEVFTHLGSLKCRTYSDKNGFVILQACSDNLDISINPTSFADYDNLIYHRCSDIPTTVKISYKTSIKTLNLAADFYLKKSEYGKSALISKELSYRQSFTNTDSSNQSEMNAVLYTAKALNYKNIPYKVLPHSIQLTDDFKDYLSNFQKQKKLKETNGDFTLETAQILATKNLDYLILEFHQSLMNNSNEVKITPLTLMVIPRTDKGEDIRSVLDQSSAKRMGIAKIKEAFDKRGFKTVDFVARLNAEKTDRDFMSLNPVDAKAKIIEMSGTDLYVEADVIISQNSFGFNTATVPLQCYDASSGIIIGINSEGCQRANRTTDIDAIVGAALGDVCLQNFLNSVQAGFNNLVIQGRLVKLIVEPSASSKSNLLSEVGTTEKNLTTLLTDWLDENTVNNNYTILGSSEQMFIADAVRIKFLDIENKNYRPYNFGNDIVSFLKNNGINANSEIRNGTIYITVN